jgi:F-type H+-transporting ATPase subunit epsilon
LIKTGREVLVAVRNAIGGANLGKLRESVEKEFMELDETERKVRSVMAKLESGFIYQLEKFSKR